MFSKKTAREFSKKENKELFAAMVLGGLRLIKIVCKRY